MRKGSINFQRNIYLFSFFWMSPISLAIFRNARYFKRDFFWRIGERANSHCHCLGLIMNSNIWNISNFTQRISDRAADIGHSSSSMSLKTESLFVCLFTERKHSTFSISADYIQWPLLWSSPSQNSLNSSIWRWSSSPMSAALSEAPAPSSMPWHSPGWCLK